MDTMKLLSGALLAVASVWLVLLLIYGRDMWWEFPHLS